MLRYINICIYNSVVFLFIFEQVIICPEIETILMVRKKPNLENNWVELLCKKFRTEYPGGDKQFINENYIC